MSDELTDLVRKTICALDQTGPSGAADAVTQLRRVAVAGVHVGRRDLTPREALEWYAGQILSVVDSQAWFAVNSLINGVDRFAPEPKERR